MDEVAFIGNTENICSYLVLLSLTHLRHRLVAEYISLFRPSNYRLKKL